MGMMIVTNNERVKEKFEGEYKVNFYDVSLREILIIVRDLIHKGHKLYTHPLSGSVKPGETVFKSIIVSDAPGKFSEESLSIIENSIITCDKFGIKFPDLPDNIKADFQCIDLTLISSALGADNI